MPGCLEEFNVNVSLKDIFVLLLLLLFHPIQVWGSDNYWGKPSIVNPTSGMGNAWEAQEKTSYGRFLY